MTTAFASTRVWGKITRAARAAKGVAAVAYFGAAGAKLLPLKSGSSLVVDASEATVRNGMTCPSELLKLQKNGVRIFSARCLHAKVFVFGKRAFVGSTNVSRHSERTLIEAALETNDRTAVQAARQFVRENCTLELGPEELKRLQKLYRPPQFESRSRGKDFAGNSDMPKRVQIVQLEYADPPIESKSFQSSQRATAKRRMADATRFEVQEFHWQGNRRFEPGDVVFQVTDEGSRGRLVSPPGVVLLSSVWPPADGKYRFVYLEVQKRRRKSIEVVRRVIGRGATQGLKTNGLVRDKGFARRLLGAWDSSPK